MEMRGIIDRIDTDTTIANLFPLSPMRDRFQILKEKEKPTSSLVVHLSRNFVKSDRLRDLTVRALAVLLGSDGQAYHELTDRIIVDVPAGIAADDKELSELCGSFYRLRDRMRTQEEATA